MADELLSALKPATDWPTPSNAPIARRCIPVTPAVASEEKLSAKGFPAIATERALSTTSLTRSNRASLAGVDDGSWTPGSYTVIHVRDPKPRLVSAAPFRDRVVQHALCAVITPIFERGFIADT